MTFKNKAVLWLILLALAFSAGFMTAYLQVQESERALARTREELRMARDEVESLKFRLQLADLRDLASLLYLEVNKTNYELAAGYSRRFFDSLEAAADEAQGDVQTVLEELRGSRDAITVLLAQGNPAAAEAVQKILARIHEITGDPPPDNSLRSR